MKFFIYLMLLSFTFSGFANASGSGDLNKVRIMTFNLRVKDAGGDVQKRHWTQRRAFVENIINGHVDNTTLGDLTKLDFLGVQEANWPELKVFGEKIGNHQTGTQKGLGFVNYGESVKLYYRTDRWILDDHGVIEIGKDQWGRRIVGWAHFKDKQVSGRGIYVLNSHWPVHGNIDGEKVTNWIAKRAHTKDPVVIMGDFNNGSPKYSFFERLDRNVHLVSVYDELLDKIAVFNLNSLGTFHGFSNGWNGSRIDHIFVSSPLMSGIKHPLSVNFSEIVHYPSQKSGDCSAFASDHFPVFVELTFE